MPTVEIIIGRRSFQLVCGEGQEQHLQQLAGEVSERVDTVTQGMDSNNDTLLLVMAALMMQDELNNLNSGAPATSKLVSDGAISIQEHEDGVNVAIADAVNAIAEYVETVAKRVESS